MLKLEAVIQLMAVLDGTDEDLEAVWLIEEVAEKIRSDSKPTENESKE